LGNIERGGREKETVLMKKAAAIVSVETTDEDRGG
jgi:hypothetical protein